MILVLKAEVCCINGTSTKLMVQELRIWCINGLIRSVKSPYHSPKFQSWNLKNVSTSCDNSWKSIIYEMASEYVRNSMELSEYKTRNVRHTMTTIRSEEIWMFLEISWILFATWQSFWMTRNEVQVNRFYLEIHKMDQDWWTIIKW